MIKLMVGATIKDSNRLSRKLTADILLCIIQNVYKMYFTNNTLFKPTLSFKKIIFKQYFLHVDCYHTVPSIVTFKTSPNIQRASVFTIRLLALHWNISTIHDVQILQCPLYNQIWIHIHVFIFIVRTQCIWIIITL
jgi:hypothetical protein